MKRKFHIVAIPIRMVLNNFGDYDPNGRMYILKENEQKVKQLVRKNPFSPVDLVQPLTIRANEGDEVEVLFENQLPEPAGIHFQEADYNVLTSDGANVGFNPDTTVKYGEKILYRIRASNEGIYFFSDLGNPVSSEEGSNIHGLYGSLIVESRGSWWTDPVTGKYISSGVYADIHHPFLPSFREYAWFFADEQPTLDLTGNRPLDPMTGQERESTHAFNYRYEPLGNRKRLIEEGIVCPECDGEEVHHDSWVFGDPSTPILRAYKGDPVKVRVIHGGVKETHVFHYHVHQWFKDLSNVDSELIDSQSISPQMHYTVAPLYGAGSLQQAIGDIIIHCHLYPHFEVGMWGLQRIFDTLQDGSQCYPNGEPIHALQPLPDRPPPPVPTAERPGFPNFIPGKVGSKAPRPPLGIVGGRGLTELERNAAVPNARPGAVFADSCLGNPVVYEFDISLIEMPLTYNREGWNDPVGRFYVLDKDLDDVLSGKKKPEPLVFHIPAGACIRGNFTNRIPNVLDGSAFQLVTRTYECGMHIHFVKFDVLCSDAANVGWNYDSSVLPGQTIRYEWYAETELKAWFFHDHLFATVQENHGVFGSGVVHPRFSKILDSTTGEETDRGVEVTVTNPLIPDYRDYAIFAQDFAMLFDKNGCPLAPPPFPGSLDDPGVFGVNLRNEPLQFRLGEDCDPAYSFSSFVKGDPYTAVFKAYKGDSIRIRLLQGAHEESHSFNLHGLKWLSERRTLDSTMEDQKTIGISESFTLETYIPRAGDYFWAFETEEDLWNGLWGLIRAYSEMEEDLIPLPDRPDPPQKTSPLPVCTGLPPCQPPEAISTAPAGAPVRRYHVVAFQHQVIYNRYCDHDPYAVIFALAEDVPDILAGRLNPEPLVLRGNAGELVEVTLTNRLVPGLFPFADGIYPYPQVKEQAPYPPSLRISLHPQLLDYDVRTSSGETVGFNYDQTVGPGESFTYKWFVEEAFGACGLWDMADIRSHRSQGAFGMFIAEPRGTRYLDPMTLLPVKSGSQAVLRNPLLPDTREFVVIMHDGVRLVDKKDQLIIDPTDAIIPEVEQEPDLLDTYDQGSRGFNYRSERLINRWREVQRLEDLFSSKVHGDPATPVFQAYPNDPIIFRYAYPSERRRTQTFHVHGHYWHIDTSNMNSSIKSVQGENVMGRVNDLRLLYGAGSLYGYPGDYMFRSGNIRWGIEPGFWGIMRVHQELQKCLARIQVDKTE
ncbi:multicopper oxidase domain-containing protein [Bacillus infantis]|uniref:multicopper oxidase domain-containing protein n=1 Tax=Bacillus infantis TaxID=324767 RepID=UPI003CEF2B72